VDLPSGTYRHSAAGPADLTPTNDEYFLDERLDGESDRPVGYFGGRVVDLVDADGPGAEAAGCAAEADGRAVDVDGPAAEAGRLDPDLISADGGIPVVTTDPTVTLLGGTLNSDSADRTVFIKGSLPSKASVKVHSSVLDRDCDTDTPSAGIPNLANLARKSSNTG
jgi:hypothetical protein